MISTNAIKDVIGAKALMSMEGLNVLVTILDTRVRFGRVDAYVHPVEGLGTKWVDASRLTVKEVA